MAQVLVVEDELSIRSFIQLNLRKAGYIVTEATTGEEALDLFNRHTYDVVLLDIMLPGIDGMSVCEQIRKQNNHVGIIMLTAKSQEEDKIYGLSVGADDYIPKPFSPNELIARMTALLRRILPEEEEHITSGPFTLNITNREVWKHDHRIEVTPTEFQLLYELIRQPKHSISRQLLMDKVWGTTYVGDPKIVDVNIRRLRRKIENDSSKPNFIITSWGKGYEWRATDL
ncbi:response regulator transcription factor [Pontibacillus litoralis]|uniref:PhoP family transcriptional regulator n=1 Tax=Pontibacillus litoralis JSM 072002 TaxID=1385512 RepID=A0A0A5G8U1_9BACI|nr:response regulator transcription factor [Pontibacillus litoralis]KGX87593.1 PhoP family transcriptional regulator [Pontibacillus litoralis JSM 072002]